MVEFPGHTVKNEELYHTFKGVLLSRNVKFPVGHTVVLYGVLYYTLWGVAEYSRGDPPFLQGTWIIPYKQFQSTLSVLVTTYMQTCNSVNQNILTKLEKYKII